MFTKIKNWFLALLFTPTIVIEETLTGSLPAQHVRSLLPMTKNKLSRSPIPPSPTTSR